MDEETDINASDESQDTMPDAEQLRELTALLKTLQDNPQWLTQLDDEERGELLQAAGRLGSPSRKTRRKIARAFRQQRRAEIQEKKEADDRVLSNRGIRRQARLQQFPSTAPNQLSDDSAVENKQQLVPLQVARNCYVCKKDFYEAHFFYDSLCPSCAELNWTKRNQTYDLTGRVALVTGGRVKIGFQAALKLLRAGADVIVTTRFPVDATGRFLSEDDSGEWKDRLQVFGLDLRHTPSVEALANHLLSTLPRLDFLLNNACQTVRRPPSFYAHLMESELAARSGISDDARSMLAGHDHLVAESLPHDSDERTSLESPNGFDGSVMPAQTASILAHGFSGINQAASLSQIAMTSDDYLPTELFPTGQFDQDLQQVDLREKNSWRLRLDEVSTVELIEVQLVNAIAPFILNAKLRPLMKQVSTGDKHIVNVSAMEGVFYRSFKTDKHPHTNMAKAALNMMTRTSAQDYIRDGIHMNAVDTGWITDEDPVSITERKRRDHGFHPPLDIVDAAARICAPIFDGLITGSHVWGQFLKDYFPSKW